MKRIFASLDIGSETIKVVVAEYFGQHYNVLASSIVQSEGIKRGIIIDKEKAGLAIRKAIDDASSRLGVPITKVITTASSRQARYTLVQGNITMDEEQEITGDDVVKVLQAAIYNEVSEEEEMVALQPVKFMVDENTAMNPKGLLGKSLAVKAILVTVPKDHVYQVISTLEAIGITVTDITIGQISDYAALKNKNMIYNVGLIVNIGDAKTEIGLFNKGILLNSVVIPIGSKSLDNDMRYIYHIDKKEAKLLKETFAVSHKRYSQVGEVYEANAEDGSNIAINQYELAEIITARLTESLKSIKNEIKNLTNKQIGYIMFTGGITEMPGLKANLEMIFGNHIMIANVDKIGIRDNSFTTALGLIKVFNEKLILRDKDYSMFDEFDEENIITTRKSSNNFSSDGVLGKVVGYFFDN